MFTLNNLSKTTTKKRRRLGRGEGSGVGKNCGKGHKGQLKRSGAKKITFEGGQKSLVRRVPKFPTVTGIKKLSRPVYSLTVLDEFFADGEALTFAAFQEKGLADKKTGQVRVVNSGKLTKKLKIAEDEKVHLTKGAKEVITS